MKKTTLGKVGDNESFKLSKKSKVWYTKILKEKGGIVYTSNSSNLSFKRPLKKVVYVFNY